MQVVEISVKSDYLPKWGFWEGVREIIQNAIDAGIKKVSYNPKTRILTVEDKGPGFDNEALLIGYTTKADDNKTIGQFGEGLKFGSLALVRSGYSVFISTRGKVFIPIITKSKFFNSNVLAYRVEKDGQGPKGTKVEIKNVTAKQWQMIKNKILLLDKNYDPLKKILTEHKYKGKIYCKGIFVHEIKHSLWGYNLSGLEINRDRNIINDYSLKREIGRAIAKSEDMDILTSFIRILQNPNIFESSVYMSSWDIPTENVRIWKEAWNLVWGENAVVETDPALKNEVEYFRYKTIRIHYGCRDVLADIVGSDAAIIEKIRTSQWTDKGPVEMSRYRLFKKVYDALEITLPVHWFKSKLKDATAMYQNGVIYIERKLSLDEIGMIGALVHEAVHAKYHFPDNTPEFNEAYGYMWKKVLKTIITTKRRD